MGIGASVDVAVMGLVVGLPPARAHLTCRSAHKGTDPGNGTGRLVAGVGDQAVIDGRGGQHAHQVEPQSPKGRTEAETGPKKQQAAKVGCNGQDGPEGVQKAT